MGLPFRQRDPRALRVRAGRSAQIAISMSAAAQSTQAAGNPQPPLVDRQKESTLALSAGPPRVASTAAAYVLDRSGCVKVRD